MSSCRSCGAAIIWARTSRGNAMPVDAEPDRDGTLALVEDEHLCELTAHVVGKPTQIAYVDGELVEPPRYTSHFETCPNADAHRQPRRTPRGAR